ncbi:MAG: hypothetical protein V3S64_00905 [bacterium]
MALFFKSLNAVLKHEGGFVDDSERIEHLLKTALFKESGDRAGTVPIPRNARSYNCVVSNCGRRALAAGYCNAHYIRRRDGRPMEAPIAHRKHGTLCSECGKALRGKGGWGMCQNHFKARRQRVLKSVLVELFGNECSSCKQSFPLIVYDFHHQGSKDDSLGYLLGDGSLKRIADEAIKCALLCANCHRMEHSDGWIQ